MYYSLRKDKFTNFGGLNGIQSLPNSLPFARISPNETPETQSNELLNHFILNLFIIYDKNDGFSRINDRFSP